MGDFSNLNTNNVKERTCKRVAACGFESYYNEYKERAIMLTKALSRYNNGRMKRYLCELFIQKDIEVLRKIMFMADKLKGKAKDIAKDFLLIVKSI